MSRSDCKYPDLGPLAKANGIKYITALQRVVRGWSIRAAATIPVGQSNPDFVKKKSGPKGPRTPKNSRPMSLEVFSSLFHGLTPSVPVYEKPGFVAKPYSPPVDRLMPWERSGYVKSPLRPKKARYVPKSGRRGKNAEDISPLHIRAIREAYCAQFIKTGVLDPEMSAKLKEYADEVHRSAERAARISAEQKAENLRGGHAALRDDNRRDGEQPDGHA